jgi:hypothetical protein
MKKFVIQGQKVQMLLFLLGFRMEVGNDNYTAFIESSKTTPSFSFFFSPGCRMCYELAPIWENLSTTYEDDPKIIIATWNCLNNSQACDVTTPVPQYPSFVAILGENVMQIKMVERRLVHFKIFVEELKSLNPSIKCPRNLNQSSAYPYLAFSFPDDDLTACDRLNQISNEFTNFSEHLILAKQTEQPSVEVILSTKWRFNYTGPNHTAMMAFIRDHLHPPLSGWPLNQSHEITVRRFGFMVHSDPNDIPHAFWFANDVIKFFVIVQVNATDFRADYPQIEVNESDLPILAVTSRDQSRFMMLKKPEFNYSLSLFVENLTKADSQPEMIYPYKYYRGEAPSQEL